MYIYVCKYTFIYICTYPWGLSKCWKFCSLFCITCNILLLAHGCKRKHWQYCSLLSWLYLHTFSFLARIVREESLSMQFVAWVVLLVQFVRLLDLLALLCTTRTWGARGNVGSAIVALWRPTWKKAGQWSQQENWASVWRLRVRLARHSVHSTYTKMHIYVWEILICIYMHAYINTCTRIHFVLSRQLCKRVAFCVRPARHSVYIQIWKCRYDIF